MTAFLDRLRDSTPAIIISWSRIYHRRLLESVANEIHQRYAGSKLGVAWAVLFPMFFISLYALVYLYIFKVRVPTLAPAEYVLYVMSGLIPILMFNEALSAGVVSISANRTLLLNTVFPPELIPLRAILAAQVPSLVGLFAALVVALWLGRLNPVSVVFVPLTLLMLILFVAGITWILSLLSLMFRDIHQALGLILVSVMMLSPIAYTPDMVPERMKLIVLLNPLSYFAIVIQSTLALGEPPDPIKFSVVVLLGISSFVVGFKFFRRAKLVFLDHA